MIYAQLIWTQAGNVAVGLDSQAGVTSNMCRKQACSQTRALMYRVSCSVQQGEVAQENMDKRSKGHALSFASRLLINQGHSADSSCVYEQLTLYKLFPAEPTACPVTWMSVFWTMSPELQHPENLMWGSSYKLHHLLEWCSDGNKGRNGTWARRDRAEPWCRWWSKPQAEKNPDRTPAQSCLTSANSSDEK